MESTTKVSTNCEVYFEGWDNDPPGAVEASRSLAEALAAAVVDDRGGISKASALAVWLAAMGLLRAAVARGDRAGFLQMLDIMGQWLDGLREDGLCLGGFNGDVLRFGKDLAAEAQRIEEAEYRRAMADGEGL